MPRDPDMIEFTQPKMMIRSRTYVDPLEKAVQGLLASVEEHRKAVIVAEAKAKAFELAMQKATPKTTKLSDILRDISTA
jgi:hypothetical protein